MMIEELQLYTTRLEDLKHFYRDTLGMEVSNATDQAFNLQVGGTKMIFKPCETDHEPFYHVAWLIPTNQFKEAKQWAASRVVLSREKIGMRHTLLIGTLILSILKIQQAILLS